MPKTVCDAKPKKVCGPETCPLEKGDRKCRDEIKHVSMFRSICELLHLSVFTPVQYIAVGTRGPSRGVQHGPAEVMH